MFIDRNDTTIKNTLRDYLAALSATTTTFRGFNINSPSQIQATFNNQMNAYIAYSGWGPSEPAIVTSPITGGTGVFSIVEILAATVPPAEVAYYTWIVATGATNGQKYSSIKNGNSSPPATDTLVNAAYSVLTVTYTGSTNIPAGVYRVYTTKPGGGLNITNGGNNWYFQGGTLIA